MTPTDTSNTRSGRGTKLLCVLATLPVFWLGACAHHPAYQGDEAERVLVRAYDDAWRQLPEPWLTSADGTPLPTALNLELVHPGVPEPDALRLWYLLSATSPESGDVPKVQAIERLGDDQRWQPVRDSSVNLNYRHTGHRTGVLRVTGLVPDATYRVILGGAAMRQPREVIARTAPRHAAPAQEFSFLVSSCFLPWAVEGDRLTIGEETRSILNSLQIRSEAPLAHRPAFHLRLGDQLYTDGGVGSLGNVPLAAYVRGAWRNDKVQSSQARVPDMFNLLYRYNFGLPPIDRSMAAVPSAMVIDDHEVRDGWGSRPFQEKQWLDFYGHGVGAFEAFQASRNPGFRASTEAFALRKRGFDFAFDWGQSAHFFVLDTRSREDCPTPHPLNGFPALCGQQWSRFQNWLTEKSAAGPATPPKLWVLALAVPLTPSKGPAASSASSFALTENPIADDAADRLGNEERARVFQLLGELLTRRPHDRLLILSGDVHYSGILTLSLDGKVRGHEVISSGLAQQEFGRKSAFVGSVIDRRQTGPFTPQTHGVDAIPSFAEIFVSQPEVTAAPTVKVLFYPGARWIEGARLQPVDLKLETRDPASLARLAMPPDEYPVSTGWNRWKVSRLAETIDKRWGLKP